MTEDLFTPRPRADSISSDDPVPAGLARGWLPAGADNPTGWRLAGLWALGSLVVAATGLVVAAVLGTGPPGMADGIERVVVFPITGGRDTADPPPPAAPVPGAPDRTDDTSRPGPLPPTDRVADPGYPVAPGVPLPPDPGPGGAADPGRLPPGTSLPVPAEPTAPAGPPQPTATVAPTVPTVPTSEPTQPTTEPTEPTTPTEPAEATTEPTVEPTTEPPLEGPPEDEPPANPPVPPDPEDADEDPVTPPAPEQP